MDSQPTIKRLTLKAGTLAAARAAGGDGEQRLASKVARRITEKFGEGWSFSHFEDDTAIAVPTRSVSEMTSHGFRRHVTRAGMKASDADSQAAYFEAYLDAEIPDRPEGTRYRMVAFDPAGGTLDLDVLTEAEEHTRSALADGVFRCKPWDLTIHARRGGGFDIRVPRQYVPSKHDDMLQTVIDEKIGRPGWWFEIDTSTYRGRIMPGEPPTFPKILSLNPRLSTLSRSVFGARLPIKGGTGERNAFMDWEKSAFMLIVGPPGSGKSVTTNVIIESLIEQGCELSICDDPVKKTDYYWCRPWVAKDSWGCDSITQYLGVLHNLVREMTEGERAKAWAKNGWQNWYDIPQWAKQQFPIHAVVVDELSNVVAGRGPLVRKLPKEAFPQVWESLYMSQIKNEIVDAITRIVRVGRALGYRMILATQKATADTGVSTAIRDLMGGRILLGDNPEVISTMMSNVFGTAKIPTVPPSLVRDGVSKGCGTAVIEGHGSFVFKTGWAGHDGLSDTQAEGMRLVEMRGLPAGIDRTRYLASLEPITEVKTVDVAFSNMLTERIALSEAKARATSGIASLIWDAWQASLDGDDNAPTTNTTQTTTDWAQTHSPISGRSLRDIAHEMGDDWDIAEDGSRVTGFEKANLARHLSATDEGRA